MVRETLEEGKVALQFLTRLPVPGPVPCRAGALAAAAPLFPLVGALIGALGAAAFALASWLGLPPALAALLAVRSRSSRPAGCTRTGSPISPTAWAAAAAAREKLAIMRDPRLGSFGALALALVTLARVLALGDARRAGAGGGRRSDRRGRLLARRAARADGGPAAGAQRWPRRAAPGGPTRCAPRPPARIALLGSFLLLPPGLAGQGLALALRRAARSAALARRQLGG